MEQSEVFERIYQDYLDQVAKVDLDRVKDQLGLELDGDGAVIPFFGIPHRVSGSRITDAGGRRPSHPVSVVLCKYLLLCPETEPWQADWVTYKDFKDAAPAVGGFRNNVEKPIAETFSGRLAELEKVAGEITGHRFEAGVTCDLSLRFQALPRLPVLMLVNDRDEDFPAQCSVLFERRAQAYLDVECIAMVGSALAWWLKKKVSAE